MKLSIKQSAMVALTIGAAALVLAACGDDDGGDNSGGGGDTGGGVVSIQSVDGTEVLADSSGRTLYSADVEKGGRILCVDGCTSFWDPVAASAGESESAAEALDVDLGVVKRPDGGRQLTFMGLPLYRFTEEGPDQLTGDGFVDVFDGTRFEWLAAAPGDGAGPAATESPSSPY
jgi:predicted lipoprotein with Yx(FWY)xxD motif